VIVGACAVFVLFSEGGVLMLQWGLWCWVDLVDGGCPVWVENRIGDGPVVIDGGVCFSCSLVVGGFCVRLFEMVGLVIVIGMKVNTVCDRL